MIIGVRIMLEGNVTEEKYELIKQKLPNVTENLGLKGHMSTTRVIGTEQP